MAEGEEEVRLPPNRGEQGREQGSLLLLPLGERRRGEEGREHLSLVFRRGMTGSPGWDIGVSVALVPAGPTVTSSP